MPTSAERQTRDKIKENTHTLSLSHTHTHTHTHKHKHKHTHTRLLQRETYRFTKNIVQSKKYARIHGIGATIRVIRPVLQSWPDCVRSDISEFEYEFEYFAVCYDKKRRQTDFLANRHRDNMKGQFEIFYSRSMYV